MNPTSFHFDPDGLYPGHVDEAGRYDDRGGRRAGRLAADGRLVGEDGRVLGWCDGSGVIRDARGRRIGYLREVDRRDAAFRDEE